MGCVLLVICYKIQPDDDPIVPKHVAVEYFKVVFDIYLFILYFTV